jgi:hypothetical protein
MRLSCVEEVEKAFGPFTAKDLMKFRDWKQATLVHLLAEKGWL